MGVLQFYMRRVDSALSPADRSRRDHADQPEAQRDVPINLIVLRACLSAGGYQTREYTCLPPPMNSM